MVTERFAGALSPAAPPVIFGLTVAIMIYAVGHISGAHFNPAVTLAFSLVRHFPKREILGYWIAQFLGAFLAIALLYALLPSGIQFGATHFAIPTGQALIWEAILSFFLMFVIIAVATDTRAVGTMAGVAIGATVTVCALLGGPVTGASMNPARTLAPAFFEGQFQSIWVYFLGPAIGCVSASFVYEWIRCEPGEGPKNAKGCC